MNKGIYTRGYLPHWDFAEGLQAVTFRLADSIPASVIGGWRKELADSPDDATRERELHRRVARFEDMGHGACVLRCPEFASIIQAKLLDGHPQRYRLLAWCVMPNHVHVLFKLAAESSLSDILRSWKGASAVEINRLLARCGHLWQREYHDRLIRDIDHLYDCRTYVRNNPVKAGLCEKPQDWQFSSAGCDWNPDAAQVPPASASEGAPASASEGAPASAGVGAPAEAGVSQSDDSNAEDER
ncbi:MAG: transposase [Verrucomicrobiota bacterium]